MPLHLAARMHAWVHGLWRTSDEVETRELYNTVAQQLAQHGVVAETGRSQWIERLSQASAAYFAIETTHPRYAPIQQLVTHLIASEGYLCLPMIDWSEHRSTSQWWTLRDQLLDQKAFVTDFEAKQDWLYRAIVTLLETVLAAVPGYLDKETAEYEFVVQTPLITACGQTGEMLDALIALVCADELQEQGLFARLGRQLSDNLLLASGGYPADPKGMPRSLLWPSKSSEQDPLQLAHLYLRKTPLLAFMEQPLSLRIPTTVRFEHSHIIAGSGHGKTQTLQYLICQDLVAVAAGQRSIIVLDSQGDLIHNIVQLAEFAPEGPLHDRLVLIDPTDVEWPVSLNLFDIGLERLQGYKRLEQERLTNSILELYDFVLGTLLAAEMTQKQTVIFRYVTRLMLHIPGATIHTLRELMEPDSHLKFAAAITKLSGSARRFFETEFIDREFTQTRKQVLRRLWGILENQTFERMFSHPRSKLDLYAEMNQGKVILINTAKDLLKEQGSQMFGRFFIALIAQAAQERATLPTGQRLPAFVYIDEAADYFDSTIGIILAQARKYKVGMVLAHQYLGQLDARLQDAFAANTSIKLAGGVSNKDARALAPMLHTSVELIERQPKGSFASYIRGLTPTAMPLAFPLGYLEHKPRLSKADLAVVRHKMRSQYAVHYTELETENQPTASDTPAAHTDPAPASDQASDTQAPPNPTMKNTDHIDTDAGAAW